MIACCNRQNLFWSAILTCLAFFVCTTKITSAQEYGFDVWTTENGLPQNTVNGITQTPDGYLWISTFDGLARFDGVRFTIFDKGNSKGIVNNRFVKIFADKDGAVWASTENGVLTVYRNGVFTSYATPEGLRETITAIAADAQGRARIETSENYYYLENGKFIRATDQKQRGERTIYFSASGAKWILTRDGVSRHKDGSVTSYPVQIDPDSLLNTLSAALYEDSRGALWFTLSSPRTYQLYRLQDGAITIFTDKEIPELKQLLPYPIIEKPDGSLWFVFTTTVQQNTALTFVRWQDGRFDRWQFKEFAVIKQGLIDREGNFWLASHQGLKRFRRQLITTLSEKDGLLSNEVYPLLQTSGGDIFIGSIKGVNRYSRGKITNLGLKFANPNKAFLIRGLWEDAQKRLWIGSYNGSGRVENDALKVINPISATAFTADQTGNLWLATDGGLFKYKDDKEIARYTIANGLPHNEVITVHEDRNGNLWAGTFDGLAQWKDGRFIHFNAVANSPRGFVRYIYEDADGVLWFGTYGDGLVRYKDGTFFNYRVEHGLFNNGVFAILEDQRGNFWMSSNRGIHRVRKQELHEFAAGKIPKLNSVSYDEKDGMLNAECNGGRIPAAIKTNDGKFWFPTMGGVAIINPEAETLNPNPPPVVIETIFIDRQPVDSQRLLSPLELSPGQTQLEIHYTGLSLIKSEQIKFRYKLEGLEKDWVEAGTARTVNYSYVPDGTYTFRVIAANANGVWNSTGTSLRIVVKPYFYQRWWFVLLMISGLAGIIWLIAHYRLSQMQKIAEAKTAFSRQLITSQEAERKRIAAELHDGLGQSLLVIKNRTSISKRMANDEEKVTAQLEEISHATGQALEEVRSIAYNLRPYHLERLGLRESIEAMIEKIREATGLEINARVSLSDEVFSKDNEVTFYRVIQECLNNIIKHAEATAVEISIAQTETEVTARVQDNGRGFVVASENQAGGFGLIGLAERIRMLGGTHSISSEAGKGTTVIVKIPRDKE